MTSRAEPLITVVPLRNGAVQAVCSSHGLVGVWGGAGAANGAALNAMGHAAAHHRAGRPAPRPVGLDRVVCGGCGAKGIVMDGVVCAAEEMLPYCRRPGGWQRFHGPWLPAPS